MWYSYPCPHLPMSLPGPAWLQDEEEGGPVSLGLLTHLCIGGAVGQSRRPSGACVVALMRSELPFAPECHHGCCPRGIFKDWRFSLSHDPEAGDPESKRKAHPLMRDPHRDWHLQTHLGQGPHAPDTSFPSCYLGVIPRTVGRVRHKR